jgi:hypothetical protein
VALNPVEPAVDLLEPAVGEPRENGPNGPQDKPKIKVAMKSNPIFPFP